MPEENAYTATAGALKKEIHALRDRIPHLKIPVGKHARRKVSSAASVPHDFIHIAANGIATYRELVRQGAPTPNQIRDWVAYALAYLPVADALETLADYIRYSAAEAMNRAGTEALTTYAIVKRLAKRPETAELLELEESMRKALGGRFRKPKKE